MDMESVAPVFGSVTPISNPNNRNGLKQELESNKYFQARQFN
jgi:hypothetical protein